MIFQYFYTFFRLSIERNPFSAKNQTLRSYRVYILSTKYASSAHIQVELFPGLLPNLAEKCDMLRRVLLL